MRFVTAGWGPGVPPRRRRLRAAAHFMRRPARRERFILTALREWAYADARDTSAQRAQQLPHCLHRYNWHRPHASLKDIPGTRTLGPTTLGTGRCHAQGTSHA